MTAHILPNVGFRVLDGDVKGKFENYSHLIKKICQVAWNILSAIIFPIGLVRLAIRVIAPQLILPASTIFDLAGKREQLNKLNENEEKKRNQLEKEIENIENIHEKRDQFLEDPNNNAEQITIETADGAEIDTVKIINENSDKWIVYFNPNAGCYEELLDDLKDISERTGANVYTGNYRGVMRSKGTVQSTHDMVLDGKAMIQKLLADGVPQDHILVHGWSIGGGVATEVASNFPNVHHCSDRSFASLIHVAKGWLPVLGGVLGGIAWLAGWRFNSTKNFEKIQGKKLVIYSKTDGVIPYKASLYKALKNKNIATDSIEYKIEADAADYIRRWKEANPDAVKGEMVAKQEFIKKLGMASHATALNETEEVFDTYIEFVKDALNLD
jgi:dienelactone hydrolase